ncbi:MAG: hypothetical protein LUE27_01975 [Clostridia bacterium]|nr:hypothetical protein [Clostridia bacterium]
MKKYLLTAIIAAMSTMCFAQDYENYGLRIFEFMDDGYYLMRGLCMSHNGRYIAGEVGLNGGMFVYDVESGDLKVRFAESAFGSSPYGISNDGVAATYDIYPMTYSIDGTETVLVEDQGSASFASDITPDGTIVVGSVTKEAGSVVIDGTDYSDNYGNACYWKDGYTYYLPEPTAEDVGLTWFETDSLTGEKYWSMDGTHASFISDDGSVIVGYFYDRFATSPCIAWILDGDSYTCYPICKGYFQEDQWWDESNELHEEALEEPQNPYFTFKPKGLSGDGKYISIDLEYSHGTEDPQNTTIGRYSMETKNLENVADNEDNSFECSGVAIDGTILAKSGSGYAYIWKPGAEPKLLRSEYSELFDNFYAFDEEGEHWPMAITPDGRYIMGFAWIYDENIDYEDSEGNVYNGYYCFYRLDTEQYANAAGIVSVTNNENDTVEGIYSVDGRRLNKLQPGINIVKKNGKTSKYLIR